MEVRLFVVLRERVAEVERVVGQVAPALVAGGGRNFSLLLRLCCPGLPAALLRPLRPFARSFLEASPFSATLGSGLGCGRESEACTVRFGRRFGLNISAGVRLLLPN